MLVIAIIYKILSETETEFTYKDGMNTRLIVRVTDYWKLPYHCTKSYLG